MKQIFIFSLMVALILGGQPGIAQNNTKKDDSKNKGLKVEVFYFHFTQRCATCRAVENNSRTALDVLFPEKVRNGEYTFKAINLDDSGSKAMAQKWKIGGQTLLVVCGNKKIDLTTVGFLYAHDPDKLKAEINNAVGKVTGN